MTGKAARTEGGCVAWELRPGGMLVQKRSHDADAHAPAWPLIKIKVSHGSYQRELSIPAQSTFGTPPSLNLRFYTNALRP